MSVASFSFFASAAVATIAALAAILVRAPRRSLAGFAIALAALIVPLVQLRAPTVAALMLLASAVIVGLLAGLSAIGEAAKRGAAEAGVGRLPLAFWAPAGLGLAGFVWVLLATGSRQVVELGPPIERGAAFGDGSVVLLELAAHHLVPAVVVGLLALCSVIAAVLTLVGERPPAAPAAAAPPSSSSALSGS